MASLHNLTSDTNRSTDSINWYVNLQHTAVDGNISATAPKVGSLVSDGGVANYTNINGMTLIPYTYNGREGYPYKATIQIFTDPWLIYNRFNPNATVNEFELEFNNDKGAKTGIDISGEESDTSANINTSRRIQW